MRIFGRAVLGAETQARLSPARLEQVRANAIRAEFLGSGLAPLTEDDVRRVATPALLVTGRDSPPVFHRLIERLAELLPDARCCEMPGASHIVHEDAAPAFNAAVLSFLAEPRAA